VDDEGSIKGLPRNLRASDIAHCCGKPLEVGWAARAPAAGAGWERTWRRGKLLGMEAEWSDASHWAIMLGCTALRMRHPPPQVKGDAFLARVMDNGDDFERLDLTLDEVSSGAPWVQQARQQNGRKRQQVCWRIHGGQRLAWGTRGGLPAGMA